MSIQFASDEVHGYSFSQVRPKVRYYEEGHEEWYEEDWDVSETSSNES